MLKRTKNFGMDENEFWKLIDMFEWKHSGDDEKVLKKAIKYLSKKSDEEIYVFADILSKLLYDLDGKVYAENIGEGAYTTDEDTYFSVDEFLYSRCVVVANGKEFYYEVLNNPTSMPEDMEFEGLLYLPSDAFELKHDEEYDYVPKFDYETFSNKSKWKE
ncbi:DUF4240 domain-containing protein [Metabacillus litoralis]|uniref:DUF4240 domain-containing protein n=1 Tax=Metabacillus litoralis TaxID=152268 RepID=UPI001CFC977E|nr:DUF4240 domain-containing protein [Metabacillus litoralis]